MSLVAAGWLGSDSSSPNATGQVFRRRVGSSYDWQASLGPHFGGAKHSTERRPHAIRANIQAIMIHQFTGYFELIVRLPIPPQIRL